MLPKSFNKYGLLPPNDYELTLGELKRSLLVKGPVNKSPAWDSAWRLTLVNNLEILVKQLWKVGITNIFINGSFAEDKDHPNDIDGYFDCNIMELCKRQQRELNLLDPHKTWIWSSRISDPITGLKKIPMWHFYKVEFFPNYNQLVDMVDKFGNPHTFPSAYRRSHRLKRQNGIVKMNYPAASSGVS